MSDNRQERTQPAPNGGESKKMRCYFCDKEIDMANVCVDCILWVKNLQDEIDSLKNAVKYWNDIKSENERLRSQNKKLENENKTSLQQSSFFSHFDNPPPSEKEE
jgi:hypothetical protein